MEVALSFMQPWRAALVRRQILDYSMPRARLSAPVYLA